MRHRTAFRHDQFEFRIKYLRKSRRRKVNFEKASGPANALRRTTASANKNHLKTLQYRARWNCFGKVQCVDAWTIVGQEIRNNVGHCARCVCRHIRIHGFLRRRPQLNFLGALRQHKEIFDLSGRDLVQILQIRFHERIKLGGQIRAKLFDSIREPFGNGH